MKKVKRIFAIIGIVLLLGLYGAAFFFALTDTPGSMKYFMAAIVATMIIPVLLWAMTFVYDILKKYYSPKIKDDEPENPEQ